jgi:outer membrane protein OmpA-like peptidoglycan-associated protein
MHAAPIKKFLTRVCTASAVVFMQPGGVLAFGFEFAAPATETFQSDIAVTSFAMPVGPFKAGEMQTKGLEGTVQQTAWSLQAKGQSTLELLVPLRDQLTAAGFIILFECDTSACGGFDFRFGMNIAAEPAMHIDLGDFRYLAAEQNGPDGPQYVSLIVSRSATLGFVQVTQVGEPTAIPSSVIEDVSQVVQTDPARPADTSPMAVGLAKQGSVALDDLIFASGAADLAPGEYASLEALASYLRVNTQVKVALVGHTDASGPLAGNIALSRERASSVRQWMISNYAIPKDQITAEGVGYLAPRDSNLTDSGLTRNRRVEVMLLVAP